MSSELQPCSRAFTLHDCLIQEGCARVHANAQAETSHAIETLGKIIEQSFVPCVRMVRNQCQGTSKAHSLIRVSSYKRHGARGVLRSSMPDPAGKKFAGMR